MAVRRGRPVEQLCNRKETSWYENHADRFRQSVQSESRIEQGICSRSRGSNCWHPQALGRRYGARWSPFSEYMSLHQSLKFITNCVPLSRIKWERYIFIKKYISFVHWSSIFIFDYALGWFYENCTWRWGSCLGYTVCNLYLHSHYSQVLWPGVVVPVRIQYKGQIDLLIFFPWCNGYRRREINTATRVQILAETDCISRSTNTLVKYMNPIILPPAMGK